MGRTPVGHVQYVVAAQLAPGHVFLAQEVGLHTQMPQDVPQEPLLGAGGRHLWREHATTTGRLLSEINPRTIIMLTLVPIPNTPLFDEARRGSFTPPTPVESVLELKELITAIHVTDTVFKSSHASNYLKVSGTLPEDKEKMLHQLERVLNNPTEDFFNPEYFRGS